MILASGCLRGLADGGGGSIKVGMWRMEALGEKPDVSLKMEAPLGCVGMTRMRHVHPTKEVHHTPGSTRRLLFVILVVVVLVFEAGPRVAQAVLKLTIKLRMTLEFYSYCLYLSSAETIGTGHYGDLFIILCMHVCLHTLYPCTHRGQRRTLHTLLSLPPPYFLETGSVFVIFKCQLPAT